MSREFQPDYGDTFANAERDRWRKTPEGMTGQYITVEYFEGKGLKPIGSDYPRSLEQCERAVERLKKACGGKYGIVRLVELVPTTEARIVTSWSEP